MQMNKELTRKREQFIIIIIIIICFCFCMLFFVHCLSAVYCPVVCVRADSIKGLWLLSQHVDK
jgi:hypothetical protein